MASLEALAEKLVQHLKSTSVWGNRHLKLEAVACDWIEDNPDLFEAIIQRSEFYDYVKGRKDDPLNFIDSGFDNLIQVKKGERRKFLEEGGSIVINKAEYLEDSLYLFIKEMEALLKLPCNDCAFFASTSRSSLFPLHVDNEHTLTIQLKGAKNWSIYSRLKTRKTGLINEIDAFPIIAREVLSPGDILYVPPLFPHRVTPLSPNSASIGLGFVYLSINELISKAFAKHVNLSSGCDISVDIDVVDALQSVHGEAWVDQYLSEQALATIATMSFSKNIRCIIRDISRRMHT